MKCRITRVAVWAVPALLVVSGISGCVAEPPPRPRPIREAPPPPPPPEVFFYPTQGQSAQQQDRDRYECHVWAVKQTGFDPSRESVPREERVTVVPARPTGENVVGTAIAGAIIGAVVSGPRHAAGGAVVGATAGGLLGAAADNAQANADATEVRRVEVTRGGNYYRRQSAEYRRALSACLEGRGYTVK